jgi:hypothetical protein
MSIIVIYYDGTMNMSNPFVDEYKRLCEAEARIQKIKSNIKKKLGSGYNIELSAIEVSYWPKWKLNNTKAVFSKEGDN